MSLFIRRAKQTLKAKILTLMMMMMMMMMTTTTTTTTTTKPNREVKW
jgi:hypothetical protein